MLIMKNLVNMLNYCEKEENSSFFCLERGILFERSGYFEKITYF